MADRTAVTAPPDVPWHCLAPEAVLARFESNPDVGLSDEEAARRLAEHGPNELTAGGGPSAWRILLHQLTSVLVVLLVVAAAVSAVLGDALDAVAILVIVVLNTVLGFVQEYRAERAIAALRQMAQPVARVRRGGAVREVPARDLVPGDIVLLEAGNIVPADGRLLLAVSLHAQEAALTGESVPVAKETSSLTDPALPLGDRRNMVYAGTAVTSGRGVAVVTATGMRTEIGRIARMLQAVEREPTPLQRRLAQLAWVLSIAAVAIVAVVFVLGLLRGEEPRLMFLAAVSLAVAAVPEGLPAVVTITLALGAQRMLRRRALIRTLPAVETLGSVTVICTDKTGTLTLNRMTAAAAVVGPRHVLLQEGRGDSREPLGPDLEPLLLSAALCTDARLGRRPDGALEVVGDPTEVALVEAAARFGLVKDELERWLPRVDEAPFSPERRRMTTMHRLAAEPGTAPSVVHLLRVGAHPAPPAFAVFTKGAVDTLLDLATHVWWEGRVEPLDAARRAEVLLAHDRLAGEGMRVLGVAGRLTERSRLDEATDSGLIFLGMIGLIDPPRPEARPAVLTCRAAGIRPVMVTGDHPLTARAIARQVGIAVDGRIITGRELAGMTGEDLSRVAEEVAVFARVAPEQKLTIVEGYQRRGHIVAMTGDGVNDAPALRRADIGVAMGITGTDVAKEAADMVLLDDNFATIVAAVEEGRVIYDNIRKFVRYTLAANSGEIWVMLFASLLAMPLPLLPLQILWINLVTDGLPSLALAVEPAERDTMRRPPRPPREPLFAGGLGRHILWVGVVLALASLGPGYLLWQQGVDSWRTMIFTTLSLAQMGHVLAVRSERDSLFTLGLTTNRSLLAAVALTTALQLAVVYIPWLQGVFDTTALSPAQLVACLLVSSVVFWGVELEKWLRRRRSAPRSALDHAERP